MLVRWRVRRSVNALKKTKLYRIQKSSLILLHTTSVRVSSVCVSGVVMGSNKPFQARLFYSSDVTPLRQQSIILQCTYNRTAATSLS